MDKSLLTPLPESETIEFKQSTAEKEDAGQDICAMANKNGGSLYFGIRNNGQPVGLPEISEKTIRDLSQLYFDNFEPRITFEIQEDSFDNQKVIKIAVPKSLQPYHTYKGIPYIRIGSTSKKMPQDEYQRRLIIYKSINQDFSSFLLEATMTDISTQTLDNLRKLLSQSGRFNTKISDLTDENLLKSLKLIQNNKLTVAALVLLGTEAGLAKHLPFAEIRYGYKVSADEIRNQDTEIYTGGYLLYYDKIWDKVNSRNISLNIPYGMLLLDKKAFEEQTIREAINNAIVHRDYRINESSFIIQYQTKIEIKSPGGFPEGVTVENILNESKSRNKLIADILYRCELVEQFGNGVNLMFKNQLSLGKNPPNYQRSDENHVILELDGKIQDVEFAKYVLKVAETKQKYLNDKELLILNRIKNNQRINHDDITKNLLELGLIERVDYGKYLLSKQYYMDTNRTWEYTKRKGLSRSKNKELILQHLQDFKHAQKSDFVGLFKNELNENQVWSLLRELRRERKIYYDGKSGSPKGVWKLRV